MAKKKAAKKKKKEVCFVLSGGGWRPPTGTFTLLPMLRSAETGGGSPPVFVSRRP